MKNLGLTETQDLAKNAVPNSRRINGKSLVNDVTLNAGDVGAYHKEEANQKFQPLGNYTPAGYSYGKEESDNRFQPKGNYAPAGNYAVKGDSYTKSESDAKYQPMGNYLTSGYSYSKNESDGRYQPKGNYAPAGSYAPKGESYTKSESDSRYQSRGNYQPAGNYAVRGECYTRGESDGRYMQKHRSLKTLFSGGMVGSGGRINLGIDCRFEFLYLALKMDQGALFHTIVPGDNVIVTAPCGESGWCRFKLQNNGTVLEVIDVHWAEIMEVKVLA